MGQGRSQHLEVLQWWRAIAALIVVAFHATSDLNALAGTSWLPLIPGRFGVEIFFALSGFIICYTSLKRFGRPGAVREFLWLRLWRVVPLYWVTTSLYIAVVLMMPQVLNSADLTPRHVLASYLFLPDGKPPVLTLGWSLNLEMLFYAVFALVLPMAALPGLLLFSALFLALVSWAGTILLGFIAGVWIGYLRAHTAWRLPVWASWALSLALLGATVLYFSASQQAHGFVDTAVDTTSLGTMGLALGCLIVGAFSASPTAPRPGLLRTVATRLGDASYSLYLTHMFTVRAMRVVLGKLGAQAWLPPVALWALMIVAACIVAWASYLWLESPVLAWARERVRADRRAPPPLLMPSAISTE